MSEPNPNPPNTDTAPPDSPGLPTPSENELLPYDDIVHDDLEDDDDDDDEDDEDYEEEEDDDSDDADMISLGSQDTDPNRPGTGSRPSRSRKRVKLDDSTDGADAAGPASGTKKKDCAFTAMTAFVEKVDMNGNKMWVIVRGRVDSQQFEYRATTMIVGSMFAFILPWIIYSVTVNEQPSVRKGQNGVLKPVFDKLETQLKILAVIGFDRPELSRAYVLETVKKCHPEIMHDPHVYDVYRTHKTACGTQTFEKRADFAFMGAPALCRFANELFGNLLRVPAYYYLYYALGQEYLDSKTDREISDLWHTFHSMDLRRGLLFTLTTLGYVDITSPAMIAIGNLFSDAITDHERMLVRLWRTHIRQPWIGERRLKWVYVDEMRPLEREGLISRTADGGVVPRSLYTLMRGSLLTPDPESVVHRWTYVACANVTMARKLIVQHYNNRGKEMPGNTDICVMDARDHVRMTPEPRKKMIMVWRAHELAPEDFFTLERVLQTSRADIFLCGQPKPLLPFPDAASGEPKTDAERRRLDHWLMNWFSLAFARAPATQKIATPDVEFFIHETNSRMQSPRGRMDAGEMISRVERAVRQNDGTLILCRSDELCTWLRTQIDSRLGAANAQRVSQGDWIIGTQGEQQRVYNIWKAAGGTMFTEVPSLRTAPFPNEFVVVYNRSARDDARIPWGISPRMRKHLIAPLEGNGFTPVASAPADSENTKRILYVTNAETLESWEAGLLSALVPATSDIATCVDVLAFRDTQRGVIPAPLMSEQETLMDALNVELAPEMV